jgi:hypothetical protein
MRWIAIGVLLGARFCFAQEQGNFKPATSNVLDAQHPMVDSNSRIQIRFKAHDASRVRVNFWSGPKADMEKPPAQAQRSCIVRSIASARRSLMGIALVLRGPVALGLGILLVGGRALWGADTWTAAPLETVPLSSLAPDSCRFCLPISAQCDFERCSVGIRNRQSVRQLQMQCIGALRPPDLCIRAKHGDILDLARIERTG